MDMFSSKFANLIAPYGVEAFFQEYYEKKVLYIKRGDCNYYTAILNTEDIDQFFQNQTIPVSMLRVVKEGVDVPSSQWCCVNRELANTNRLFSLFHDDHTWIINAGNRAIPKLSNYCNELERELKFRLQFNVYITPTSAKGFSPHFDDHDVFILQTTGSKRWRLYNIPIELPTSKFKCKEYKDKFDLDQPSLEVELQPGDLLYIPRGVVHDAVTTDQASVHITMGLHPSYLYELLQEVANVAVQDVGFRRAIHNGLSTSETKAAIKAEFLELTHTLIDNLDIDQLFERRYADYLRRKPPEDRCRFLDTIQVHRLTLNSVICKRENVLFQMEKTSDQLLLKFSGKVLEFGLFAESSLNYLLQSESIAVKDIGGFINDKGRLELATQFIQEGFSRLEALNAEA